MDMLTALSDVIETAKQLRPDTNIKVIFDVIDDDLIVEVHSIDIFEDDNNKFELLAKDKFDFKNSSKSIDNILSILRSHL